jgi:hypothetical protein
MPSACHIAVTSYATEAAGLPAVDPPLPRASILRRQKAASPGPTCDSHGRRLEASARSRQPRGASARQVGGDEQAVARDLDAPLF